MQGFRCVLLTIASMVSLTVKGQRFGRTRIGNRDNLCANTTAPQAAVPGTRRQPSKCLRRIRMFDTAATNFTASPLPCAMRLQIMFRGPPNPGTQSSIKVPGYRGSLRLLTLVPTPSRGLCCLQLNCLRMVCAWGGPGHQWSGPLWSGATRGNRTENRRNLEEIEKNHRHNPTMAIGPETVKYLYWGRGGGAGDP